jgi:hypothetical protein
MVLVLLLLEFWEGELLWILLMIGWIMNPVELEVAGEDGRRKK